MIDPTLKLMIDLSHANARNIVLFAAINAIGAHIGEDLSEMSAEELADRISEQMLLMRSTLSVVYTQHAERFEAARVESELEGVIDR